MVKAFKPAIPRPVVFFTADLHPLRSIWFLPTEPRLGVQVVLAQVVSHGPESHEIWCGDDTCWGVTVIVLAVVLAVVTKIVRGRGDLRRFASFGDVIFVEGHNSYQKRQNWNVPRSLFLHEPFFFLLNVKPPPCQRRSQRIPQSRIPHPPTIQPLWVRPWVRLWVPPWVLPWVSPWVLPWVPLSVQFFVFLLSFLH